METNIEEIKKKGQVEEVYGETFLWVVAPKIKTKHTMISMVDLYPLCSPHLSLETLIIKTIRPLIQMQLANKHCQKGLKMGSALG